VPYTGSSITYVDQHREAANTNNPKLDAQLDTSNIAPSLTSNMAPPRFTDDSLNSGSVTPYATSNLEFYANRIWYFIGNKLYFSGNE
jgi:hypothetical protein